MSLAAHCCKYGATSQARSGSRVAKFTLYPTIEGLGFPARSFFYCVYASVHVCVCINVYGGERSISAVFLNHSPPYFGGQSLSLKLELQID